MDINRIQLTGRLDREPLLYDVGDHHVAALHLVARRNWRTRSGVWEQAHEYYRLTAWEDLADECGRLLHAGDAIYVAGRLRLFTSWTGGIEHTAHEIVLDHLLLLAPARPQPEAADRITPFYGRSRSGIPHIGSHLALRPGSDTPGTERKH